MHKGIAVMLALISLGWGSVATAGAENGKHHGNPSTTASAHMSDQGGSNTNAQWSGSATKGQDRSDLRSGDHQGHDQNHGQHHGKGKGHGQGKHQ
jgi:hypothetical protein